MVRDLTNAATALTLEHGLALWGAWAMMLRGRAMAQEGEPTAGVEEMRRGLEVYRDINFQFVRPFFLCLFAEACGAAGRYGEALTVLEEMQALIETNDERFWEAELYRVRGELLLAQPAVVSDVEACFHRAIEVAAAQRAKSLELRAVMSLAKLWSAQGKQSEARARLADVYGWFAEGFETADLQDARALLDQLS
jgi:predicted ATPase